MHPPSFGHCHRKHGHHTGVFSRTQVLICVVGMLSKLFLKLQRVDVRTPAAMQQFCKLIHERNPSPRSNCVHRIQGDGSSVPGEGISLGDGRAERVQPLITVANHVSVIDDPVLCGLLPTRTILTEPSLMKWTLGAREILFSTRFRLWLFGHGRGIPTVRGGEHGGVDQLAIDKALDRLDHGDWVHVFPEAKVNQKPSMLPFRRGIGKLIAECKHKPIVIPIYHRGLEEVCPEGRLGGYGLPSLGKRIRVWVGPPVVFRATEEDGGFERATHDRPTGERLHHDSWVRSHSSSERRELYHRLTAEVEQALRDLETIAFQEELQIN